MSNKQSIHTKDLDRGVNFFDGFESKQNTQDLGGIITTVVYINGVGILDGSSYVDYGDVFDFQPTDVFSVRIRVKFSANTSSMLLIGRRKSASPFSGWMFFYNGVTKETTFRIIDNTTTIRDSSVLGVDDAKWHELIGTNDGSTTRLYLDGTTAGDDDSTALGAMTNSATMRIGNDDAILYYTGSFDFAEIWNTALTAEQVSNLNDNKTYKEISREGLVFEQATYNNLIFDRQNNEITNKDSVEIKKEGLIYAPKFDGNISHLNIDSIVNELSTTSIGTWIMWVKPFVTLPSSVEIILSVSDGSAPDIYFNVFIQNSGKLRVAVVNSATQWAIDTTNVAFEGGKWSHLAIVKEEAESFIYINGVKVAQSYVTSTDKSNYFADMTGLDSGRIGSLRNNGSEIVHLKGMIDNVKSFTNKKTASQIMQDYTSTKHNYGL